MEVFDLVIAAYRLIVRALALALSDPEFQADWVKFEQDLGALGIDLPGTPAAPAATPVSTDQAVPRPSPRPLAESVIQNPDGTVSLREDS